MLNNIYKKYLEKVELDQFKSDSLQLELIYKLQKISNDLNDKKYKKKIKGMYIWGGVGRGKTLIMDLFYQELKNVKKYRCHIHEMMETVNIFFNKHKGKKKLVFKLAKHLANKFKIICLDELIIKDIANAMIIGNLFRYLYKFNVTLVVTSNTAIDKLYQSGLQYELFLPLLVIMTDNMHVFHLDQGIDYRTINSKSYYYFPLCDKNNIKLKKIFLKKCIGIDIIYKTKIILEDRNLEVIAINENIIWVDFKHICGNERGINDYITLAMKFPNILISNIPILDEKNENEAQRFISMIDEFYEKKINIFLLAETTVKELYRGKLLKFDFQRTISRLQKADN